jgi:CheY-like chemotaxis protein
MRERQRIAHGPRRFEVLMIEDDPEYRVLVKHWLTSSPESPFSLSFAPRLDDAWHRIDLCDAIVLDLGLPDAAGMETLVATRELAGDLPIVVLTGMDDDGTLGQQALCAGADAFVPKRVAGADTLQVALRRALHAHRHAGPSAALAEKSGDDFWIDARFAR